MAAAMAVDGIPLDVSVNHVSNKYPGVIASWESITVFEDTHRAHALFTVVVSGNFQPDSKIDPTETIDNWIQLLHTGCTNKWNIDHEFEPTAPPSKITFNMYYSRDRRFATLNSKMRVYKAAVELENLLLTKLLPLAVSQFKIETRALPLSDFHGIFEESSDSNEDHTREWLNTSTMDRVYTWITIVVPTFVRCWMPDVKVEALEAYDASSTRSINGKQSLLSSDDSVLVMVSAPRGLVSASVGDKAAVAELGNTEEAIRHPCKMQVVSTHENPLVSPSQTLQYTKLVDITSAFATTHQVLVRKSLLDTIHTENGESRVFCVFPSFDEFPGLLSEEGRALAYGSLHCNPDRTDENGNLVGPPTVFKTSGIVQCPGETLARTTADTCQPDSDIFRIRKSNCDELPYTPMLDDPTCCLLSFDLHTSLASDMRVYGNRTVDRSRDFLPMLNDAYEWFEREIGIEGPIIVPTWNDNSFRETYQLFKHFMPNCSTLEVGIGNTNDMARAIDLMTFATERGLVHNTMLRINVTESMSIDDFFPVFKLFPKNTTEIRLGMNTVPTTRTIMILDKWISAQERRQVDVVYDYKEESSTENHSTRFKKVWTMMLSNGYRRFGPTTTTEVIQMRKGHVQLTIDWTKEEHSVRQTHLRYVAGAPYTPRAMTRPHA